MQVAMMTMTKLNSFLVNPKSSRRGSEAMIGRSGAALRDSDALRAGVRFRRVSDAGSDDGSLGSAVWERSHLCKRGTGVESVDCKAAARRHGADFAGVCETERVERLYVASCGGGVCGKGSELSIRKDLAEAVCVCWKMEERGLKHMNVRFLC